VVLGFGGVGAVEVGRHDTGVDGLALLGTGAGVVDVDVDEVACGVVCGVGMFVEKRHWSSTMDVRQ
jgi:hypothetical protein